MPKRRKRQRTIISDAETSAVPVQEAAEVPPVEPEVACQPVLPTRVHWSLSSKWHQSIVASMRQLARSRKQFAKIELYWNRRRMVENRTLDAFRRRFGPEGGSKWNATKWLELRFLTLINQHSIEEFALEDTRKQWKLEVEWLELDRHQLMMQVAALHEQISELRAVHGHE